jgi:hypothetical protein
MLQPRRLAPALLAVALAGSPALGAAQTSTVYADLNYQGKAVNLAPGAYTLSALQALGIANDSISSIKVESGYVAYLFENDFYSGRMLVKTGDVSYLGTDGFNDALSSLIIIPSSWDQTYVNGQYTLRVLNVGQLPSDTINRIIDCWHQYPAMAARFHPTAPNEFLLVIDPTATDPNTPAVTYDHQTTRMSADWMRQHPLDADVMTHEEMHVVQHYQGSVPLWVSEGLADYARYRFGVYNAQAGWALGPPSSNANYTDSYRTTAAFLVWLEKNRSTVADDLNAACENGSYSSSFWTSEFGESVDELWADYAGGASAWSTSLPNLSDGTYKCTGSRPDAHGLSAVQDCTRAVTGGYWQTVTIFANSSTHIANVSMSVDSIYNASVAYTVRCAGTIPNGKQRACWGKTLHNSSGYIQAHDNGASGSYSGTFNGAIYFVVVPASYSPTRPIVK